ncbi:MAG: hypothetical protein WC947_08185 [Elusimicrobiota bacterium]
MDKLKMVLYAGYLQHDRKTDRENFFKIDKNIDFISSENMPFRFFDVATNTMFPAYDYPITVFHLPSIHCFDPEIYFAYEKHHREIETPLFLNTQRRVFIIIDSPNKEIKLDWGKMNVVNEISAGGCVVSIDQSKKDAERNATLNMIITTKKSLERKPLTSDDLLKMLIPLSIKPTGTRSSYVKLTCPEKEKSLFRKYLGENSSYCHSIQGITCGSDKHWKLDNEYFAIRNAINSATKEILSCTIFYGNNIVVFLPYSPLSGLSNIDKNKLHAIYKIGKHYFELLQKPPQKFIDMSKYSHAVTKHNPKKSQYRPVKPLKLEVDDRQVIFGTPLEYVDANHPNKKSLDWPIEHIKIIKYLLSNKSNPSNAEELIKKVFTVDIPEEVIKTIMDEKQNRNKHPVYGKHYRNLTKHIRELRKAIGKKDLSKGKKIIRGDIEEGFSITLGYF